MPILEVCIHSDGPQSVYDSVSAAYRGGASTIELCSAMHLDGLTPSAQHISQARKAFGDRPGLMVMIRPRGGDFCYSTEELQVMQQQIKIAAAEKADGVVFGVLRKADNRIDLTAFNTLVHLSRDHGLSTTFHRAFDATPNPLEAVDTLIDAGIDRVLTSGTSWDSRQPATAGIAELSKLTKYSTKRIEIVIGGGINSLAMHVLKKSLPIIEQGHVSFHSYSAARENDATTESAVRTLVEAAKS